MVPYKNQGQDLEEFPNLRRWFDVVKSRPAVSKGLDIGKAEREKMNLATDANAQSVLFGQRARA
ncbi:hypothetical protein LCGC14_0216300 [marine sediment metagenome]|uniref:GST C-terminal domain-containing protein n=1 Tax=marine sediment metagenome TaxID=412755 RepID=A0A0F9WYJ5_9ZZZZ